MQPDYSLFFNVYLIDILKRNSKNTSKLMVLIKDKKEDLGVSLISNVDCIPSQAQGSFLKKGWNNLFLVKSKHYLMSYISG